MGQGRHFTLETLALEYAQTFETSPPQWHPARKANTPLPRTALPIVNFRGKLCASSRPALLQLQELGFRHRQFSLQVGMVADIDLTESQNNLSGGTVHEFAKEFQTSTDGENLTFGHVTVMTGDYDRDPEEEYEDEAY